MELGDYLDGQVSAEVRRDLEEHLSRCRTCEVLVDSTRKTLRIVAENWSYEVPAEVSAKILAKVRAALEEK